MLAIYIHVHVRCMVNTDVYMCIRHVHVRVHVATVYIQCTCMYYNVCNKYNVDCVHVHVYVHVGEISCGLQWSSVEEVHYKTSIMVYIYIYIYMYMYMYCMCCICTNGTCAMLFLRPHICIYTLYISYKHAYTCTCTCICTWHCI